MASSQHQDRCTAEARGLYQGCSCDQVCESIVGMESILAYRGSWEVAGLGHLKCQCLETWFLQWSLRTDRMLGSGIHEEGVLGVSTCLPGVGTLGSYQAEHILGGHCPCHLPRTNTDRNDLNLASS